MTTEGTAPRPQGGGKGATKAEEQEERDFVRYLFFRIAPAWRRLEPEARRAGREEVAHLLEAPPESVALRTYSLVGTKAGVHGLLWMVAPRLEAFQELEARLAGTRMGGYLEFPYGYLGMGRRSEYLGGHVHGGQKGGRIEPSSRPYLFVYPFVKKREWYALPFEERQRIMGEHFRIGHRFPKIEIHTGYSFGIDDAEFILAFEAEDPREFLDLVQALRPTEASRYTQLETPIFTAVAAAPARMLELADGLDPRGRG